MCEQATNEDDEHQGEHGIGLGKKGSLVKELGTDTLNVMRSIKRALDPNWLMNPGKIFDVTDVQPTHDEAKATAASTLKKPEDHRQRVHGQMVELR